MLGRATGEFVTGSPLIALEAQPRFTHHALVDTASECTAAREQRFATAGAEATIICADSNAPIRRLTDDRPMDLLINLPIHSLYRCLAAGYWSVLDDVLGPDWPRSAPGGVPGWRAAIRAHYLRVGLI